jgi:hypothetical protein
MARLVVGGEAVGFFDLLIDGDNVLEEIHDLVDPLRVDPS